MSHNPLRQSWRDFLQGEFVAKPSDHDVSFAIIRDMGLSVAEYDALVLRTADRPNIKAYLRAVEGAREKCHAQMRAATDQYGRQIEAARAHAISEASRHPDDARLREAGAKIVTRMRLAQQTFNKARVRIFSEYLYDVQVCVSRALNPGVLLDMEHEVVRLYNEKESKR